MPSLTLGFAVCNDRLLGPILLVAYAGLEPAGASALRLPASIYRRCVRVSNLSSHGRYSYRVYLTPSLSRREADLNHRSQAYGACEDDQTPLSRRGHREGRTSAPVLHHLRARHRSFHLHRRGSPRSLCASPHCHADTFRVAVRRAGSRPSRMRGLSTTHTTCHSVVRVQLQTVDRTRFELATSRYAELLPLSYRPAPSGRDLSRIILHVIRCVYDHQGIVLYCVVLIPAGYSDNLYSHTASLIICFPPSAVRLLYDYYTRIPPTRTTGYPRFFTMT